MPSQHNQQFSALNSAFPSELRARGQHLFLWGLRVVKAWGVKDSSADEKTVGSQLASGTIFPGRQPLYFPPTIRQAGPHSA